MNWQTLRDMYVDFARAGRHVMDWERTTADRLCEVLKAFFRKKADRFVASAKKQEYIA